MSGRLAIGVIPTISPYLLPVVAPAMRKAYPRLTVVWREEKTTDLVRQLRDGPLDAALLALEADIGDLERAVIAEDRFVLAMSPRHVLAATSTPARATDLRDAEVLLLDDGHCFRDQALAVCSRTRVRESEFRATSLSTLTQMVAAGTGVTLLPALAVATEAARTGLRVRAFIDPAPHRTIGLVWRRRSPLAASLRRIAATIQASYPNRAGRQ